MIARIEEAAAVIGKSAAPSAAPTAVPVTKTPVAPPLSTDDLSPAVCGDRDGEQSRSQGDPRHRSRRKTDQAGCAVLFGESRRNTSSAPVGAKPPAAPVAKAPEKPKEAAPAAPAPAPAAQSPIALQSAVKGSPGEFDANGVRREPMTRIRKRIAETLVAAQKTAAILTTFNEIDLTNVMDLRARYKEKFNEVHGIGLGFMSFFARAACQALREYPRVNAFLETEDVVYHDYVNLGIAVSTDRGLAVPVLRNVQEMGFARIESEVKRLAAATRDGKLALHELSGATFTITNGGVFGSLLSTPILTPPQSGILGMHAIQKRPVVINDKIEIRNMMYVVLSYDHRLVDGRESVSFLVRMKQLLEDPARLLLEV